MANKNIIQCFFFIGLALMTWSNSSYAQGSQQISSRKIREVVTTTYDNRKGQGETVILTERYNSKGLIIERIETNESKEVVQHELFEYGKKKKLVVHTILNEKSGQAKEVIKFTFDKWGNEISEERFGPENKLKQKILSKYDLSGKKILEEIFDASGNLIKSTSNTYDNRGMLLVRTTKDGNGQVVYTKSNTYTY